MKPKVRQAPTTPIAKIREYLHALLLLALLPLAVSLAFRAEEGDLTARLDRSLEAVPAADRSRVEQLLQDENVSDDDKLAALPGNRIAGAHLPRKTWGHWVYAAASAAAFLTFLLACFHNGAARPTSLLIVGLFTGTLGIVFLLAVQFVAAFTQGFFLYRGNPFILLIFYIIKFIGYSYRSALDPDSNFLLSLMGFTFGVGLCEEICKAIPLFWHFQNDGRHRDSQLGWRGVCLWGLASGAGFGVAEGIMYSGEHYNGVSYADTYLLRFVSCVALHAMFTGSVALTMWLRSDLLDVDREDWLARIIGLLTILGVPMILHGLYDTLLKKDMELLALLPALATFAWFAWLVEMARTHDES